MEGLIAAIEAFYDWKRGEREPMVEYEIHYERRQRDMLPAIKRCERPRNRVSSERRALCGASIP
jgi:hypothetical protein